MISKPVLTALALAVLLGGGTGAMMLSTDKAVAESTATVQGGAPSDQAQAQAQAKHERHAALRHARLEGRIAALKTELAITDAQAPQWEKVAQAMRQSADEMGQFHRHGHHMHGMQGTADKMARATAVDRLAASAKRTEAAAQAKERFLAAFKPLYDSMSDQQKKIADDLFVPHHHFGRH